ncbi:MAG: hypothetical protein JSV33_02545 [bacterium]|nr:MAG: hypothetical protein JSV33_02545 [bacterium]
MRGPFDPASRPSRRLIVISGLDGSGKTTQCEILARQLGDAGIHAETVWNRWEPLISAPLIKLAKGHLTRRQRISDDDYTQFTDAKRRTMRSPFKRRLWQLMVWSEYALEVALRFVRRPNAVLICDRYVYDTVVDIAINFHMTADELEYLLDHPLFVLYPTPALVIFLDIAPEIGASRKTDGTPVAYLADRREYYLAMARILNAPVIDGAGDITQVAGEIWSRTEQWRAGCAGEGKRGPKNGGYR